MLSTAVERVRAVVIDHDGGEMTVSCVQRLLAANDGDVPFEVVVVDNGSARSVAKTLTREPGVEVRASAENLGFAGGANLGLRDLDNVTYVALVNNDVEVSNGWLGPLLERLRAHPHTAAACPKMLFAGRFLDVEIEAPTHVDGRGDQRALGVRIHAVEAPASAATEPQFVSGFHGPEYGGDGLGWFQWTSGRARLHVPVAADAAQGECGLRLSAREPTTVTVRSGDTVTSIAVGVTPSDHRVTLSGQPFDVVNNAGSIVRGDGYGLDRGLMERDSGQFEDAVEVQAWCGGAVLLRTEYLRDVGLFDDRLFLYYEDLELSRRGERQWTYEYEPRSVVRHRHGATAIHGSSRTEILKERNRLLVLSRYASAMTLLREVARYLLSTASYARRDIIAPVLHGRAPSPHIVGRRLQAFGGFLRLVVPMRRRTLPAHIRGGPNR